MTARLGMATKEGWESFMRIIDAEKIRKSEAAFIEGLLGKEPTSNIDEDRFEFDGVMPAEGEQCPLM